MDYQKLEDAIAASGKTKTHIAKALGITTQALYNKLSGKSDFTRAEVGILCKELGITSLREKERIFF